MEGLLLTFIHRRTTKIATEHWNVSTMPPIMFLVGGHELNAVIKTNERIHRHHEDGWTEARSTDNKDRHHRRQNESHHASRMSTLNCDARKMTKMDLCLAEGGRSQRLYHLLEVVEM